MYVESDTTVPQAWDDGAVSSMDKMLENMKTFKAAALAGSVEVNQAGGDALLRVIREMKDWVVEAKDDLMHLQQRPKLGTSAAALVMAPFVQQVASDGQGLGPQLAKFGEVLREAEEGIKKAMQTYRENEGKYQATLRAAGGHIA